MSPTSRPKPHALTALVGIVATVLVGWVLTSGAHILQPLVIAILLCNILQPVVRFLARFKIPSWATVVALLALFVMGVQKGSSHLYAQINAFLAGKGGYRELLDQLKERAADRVPPEVLTAIEGFDVKGQILDVIGTVGGFTRGLFLVALYMIFIFAEQAVFRRKILAVAESHADDAEKVLDAIGYGIQRYLGVKTVTSLATGVLCYSVLLYLQIEYAMLFGFLTFLLNYIPTFGSFAAAAFPIATALATREGYTDPLIVAGTYLTVNIVLGSFLEPRMLGRELNLSPLVILVSVVVWAALWGVPGMFLAVPLTAAAQIVLANIESTRSIAVLLSNGPPPRGRKPKRRPQREVPLQAS